MERVVLRHLSGSKANQVEEFPLAGAQSFLIGREPSARVRYHPERDDLVGRQHARILQDPANPYGFSLVDLDSRNGTFLNRQRVRGEVALSPGDIVQFGPGGPELQFDLAPLPPTDARASSAAGTKTQSIERPLIARWKMAMLFALLIALIAIFAWVIDVGGAFE